MKTRILKILRNAEGYVSGQAICEQLGVSRTAVWKVINQLKEEGYEFDAVVIDDGMLRHARKLSPKERLERLIYLAEDRQIQAKYIKGKQVLPI